MASSSSSSTNGSSVSITMALSSSRRHFHLRVFCSIWFARALCSGCGVLISLSSSTCACISVNVFLNSSLSSVFVSSSGLSMYLARVLSVTAVSCAVLVCTLDCGFGNEVPLGVIGSARRFPIYALVYRFSMCTQPYRRKICKFWYLVPCQCLVWLFRTVRCPEYIRACSPLGGMLCGCRS